MPELQVLRTKANQSYVSDTPRVRINSGAHGVVAVGTARRLVELNLEYRVAGDTKLVDYPAGVSDGHLVEHGHALYIMRSLTGTQATTWTDQVLLHIQVDPGFTYGPGADLRLASGQQVRSQRFETLSGLDAEWRSAVVGGGDVVHVTSLGPPSDYRLEIEDVEGSFVEIAGIWLPLTTAQAARFKRVMARGSAPDILLVWSAPAPPLGSFFDFEEHDPDGFGLVLEKQWHSERDREEEEIRQEGIDTQLLNWAKDRAANAASFYWQGLQDTFDVYGFAWTGDASLWPWQDKIPLRDHYGPGDLGEDTLDALADTLELAGDWDFVPDALRTAGDWINSPEAAKVIVALLVLRQLVPTKIVPLAGKGAPVILGAAVAASTLLRKGLKDLATTRPDDPSIQQAFEDNVGSRQELAAVESEAEEVRQIISEGLEASEDPLADYVTLVYGTQRAGPWLAWRRRRRTRESAREGGSEPSERSDGRTGASGDGEAQGEQRSEGAGQDGEGGR